MKRLAMSARFSSVAVLLALLDDFQGARAVDVLYQGPDSGSWNVTANWNSVAPPDVAFNEAGVIQNGATVILNEHTKSSPSGFPPLFDVNIGGLRLGSAAATTGRLRVVGGGILEAVPFAGGGETGAIAVGGAGQGNLTILGNGIVSGTSLSLGGSTSSSITISDTARLTVRGTANLERTTTISGPSVTFSAGGDLTLGSSSTLIADIRSNTAHSALRTESAANVARTIKPMFTGVTPAVGNKWTLVNAATGIASEFATVDVSMVPALPAGQAYRLFEETAGPRTLLQLAVEEVLTLQVNRVTGATSIANVGSTAKTIDGYSIISPHGSLTGSWNSLDDQDFGGPGSWLESPPGPTPNDLSELRPQSGGSTISAGNSLNLGTPYVKTFPAFGVDPDDISFEYTTPDERIINGSVVYTGAKTANNFVLTVDPATGAVAFRNDSPFSIAIDGYAIYSATGSLASATWNSLQDQSASVPGAAGWEQAPPALSNTAVAELKAGGTTVFQPQTGFSLGNLFKTVGATQDLRFELLLSGSATPNVGQVTYGGVSPPPIPSVEFVPGDYDGNGVVDGRDLNVWRQQFGLTQGVQADGDQDGDADGHDFLIWQRNLDVPPPIGSGDVNGNGVTDINDYIIIRNNFLGTNKTLATGDLTGDTLVNFADFRHWKNARTAAVAAAGWVPEPAGWALAVMGLGMTGAARRHREN
jgi:hypothetical protein